ncbi:MAG: glycosyltransferase, partial [Desulfobulbaceae bacterium]|nr:glycosyltransferase [Desulfobulbaceae bacterium]
MNESKRHQPPEVSWLLCSNRTNILFERAIQSCLTQTLDNFELLIVINGVNAREIAPQLHEKYKQDPRVRIVETPIHLLNFSLSLGLHLARAPYVARMDADDVSHPDRLARQLDFMERHPSVAVLGTAYELIDESGNVHGTVSPPESDSDIRRSLHYRNPICHPSVMLRKQAILQAGGYLGGQNAEDYDLWSRIALDPTRQFANMPDVLLSYNSAPGGAARR